MSVSDIVALVSNLIGLVTAITVLVRILIEVRRVHTLVNQHATDAALQNERLTGALIVAGVPVPHDPSLKTAGEVASELAAKQEGTTP